MSPRDVALPLLARALFALPPGVQRRLGGPVPAPAAGLAPDAWLVARLARSPRAPPPRGAGLAPDAWVVARLARYQRLVPGERPVAEVRAHFERSLAPVTRRMRLP